jgi:hypothetical protein
MKIILSEVYNNNNIYITISYCNGIFTWSPYFHFAEPRVSAEHHLRNTVPHVLNILELLSSLLHLR